MSWGSAVKKALALLCVGLLGSAVGGFLAWDYVLGDLEKTLLGALKHQYWSRRSDCDEAYSAGGEVAEFGLKKAISLAHFYHGSGVIDATERDFDIFVSLARLAKVKRDSGDEQACGQYVRRALSLGRELKIDDTVSDAEKLFVYLGRIDTTDAESTGGIFARVFPEDAASETSAGE